MFVAHLPAGYLITRVLLNASANESSNRRYLLFGSICSILPDADLVYFYTLGARQYPHHSYWTHMPVFWLAVACSIFILGRLTRQNWGLYSLLLLCNTWLHLLLDSVAGGIYWLFPFSEHYYRVFTITARYDWWVFNYILHWTFLLEVLIVAGFALQLRRDIRTAYLPALLPETAAEPGNDY